MAEKNTFVSMVAFIGHNNDILRFSAISNPLISRNCHFSEPIVYWHSPLYIFKSLTFSYLVYSGTVASEGGHRRLAEKKSRVQRYRNASP